MLTKKHLPVIKKVAYFIVGIIGILLLAMISIPYFFKTQIESAVKDIANKNINGELQFTSIDLSFFTHFPSLTTSIHDVKLKGSAPFQDSLLLDVNEISLGVDVLSLFKDKITLNKFIVSSGKINVFVDSTGAANYNIYTAASTTPTTDDDSNGDSQIAFKLLKLKDINLHYQDASIPMTIEAIGLDYEGRGDLSSSIFDLKTNAKIEAFTFIFDNEKYVDRKSINAQLITKINTNNLSFVFEKNDIIINKLPVRFKGEFAFLPNGYHLDFKLKSQESTLEELLSLVPQGYSEWLKDTKIKGSSEVFMDLEGDYIVEENKMPNLSLGMIINNGYLSYKDSKVPLSNLNTKIKVDLPQLSLDSLAIDLQQFDFNVANGYFKTEGKIKGIDPMQVRSTIHSSLDLGSLYQAVQWPDFSFAGQLELDAKIDGVYATDTLIYGIRNKKEVYISSIPTFNIKNSLTNGYFKINALPAAIEKIAYSLEAIAVDNNIKNATISLRDLDIKALNNYIKGYAEIKDFQKMKVDANVQADINLGDIKQVYPLDSMDIAGNVFVNIISQGYMDLTKNIIPTTSATVTMKNGYYKSWAYPIPLEEINVETYINSQTGSLKDLNVQILPISFLLAGEPFFLHADFKNFNDINYVVRSKGKINLEPFYKIFALEGININGYVRTDLDLAGLQSDALKGKYNRLKNDGTLEIGNINVNTELLPQAIQLKSGKFTFRREKLLVDRFLMEYGDNKISIKGAITNIINYLTTNKEVLKGKFELKSNKLNVNDFMAFNDHPSSSATATAKGVVLLPDHVDMDFIGQVNNVYYDQIRLKNFKGNLKLKSGQLALQNTGFELAGMKTNMNINYRPLNPNKAKFDFNVKADNFDIYRAYQEIPLFKEMVTSAKNMRGTVSMDYQLGGLLNDEMSPIMPSIQGKGSLTLDQIQFYNFKLLNTISKTTGKENLAKSDVKKVTINTSIKNNVMTIERTKMKMAGFRPRFEGQVTLDGKMNLGFRLGLPPWGIFGIPMRITGTSENFKIKLGKYKEDDLDTDMDEDDKSLYEASLAQDTIKVN